MREEQIAEFADLKADRTIHVTVPAEVAFDLKRFQKVQQDILGKLGCSACTSGFDIRFDIQRRFIVDEKLNVQPQLGLLGKLGR